jgi:hypothetical protein
MRREVGIVSSPPNWSFSTAFSAFIRVFGGRAGKSTRPSGEAYWPDFATYANLVVMEISSTRNPPAEFLSELEQKFFWWEPVGSQPRSDARILAQAMRMAGFDEVRRLELVVGCDRLAAVMLGVEPGWIDERSWEFWRGRLTRATGRSIPDQAPMRVFDARSV